MKKAIKAFAHETGAVLLSALSLCAPCALGAEAQKGVMPLKSGGTDSRDRSVLGLNTKKGLV